MWRLLYSNVFAFVMASFATLYVCITSLSQKHPSFLSRGKLTWKLVYGGMKRAANEFKRPVPFFSTIRPHLSLSCVLWLPRSAFISLSIARFGSLLRTCPDGLLPRWAGPPWHRPNEWAGWFIACDETGNREIAPNREGGLWRCGSR